MLGTYRYTQDPGHGWVEVPTAELRELGIVKLITTYSYQRRGMAYLEEDCDAGTWMRAYRGRVGSEPVLREEHVDQDSPIRGYQQFGGRGQRQSVRITQEDLAREMVAAGLY